MLLCNGGSGVNSDSRSVFSMPICFNIAETLSVRFSVSVLITALSFFIWMFISSTRLSIAVDLAVSSGVSGFSIPAIFILWVGGTFKFAFSINNFLRSMFKSCRLTSDSVAGRFGVASVKKSPLNVS